MRRKIFSAAAKRFDCFGKKKLLKEFSNHKLTDMLLIK